MKTAEIRQKLHRYIDTVHEKKLKAIYTMVEEEVATDSHWNDKAFIAEIDKRIAQLETGKTKGYTWAEVRKQAAKTLKSVKDKR
jgi:hypothetical protein